MHILSEDVTDLILDELKPTPSDVFASYALLTPAFRRSVQKILFRSITLKLDEFVDARTLMLYEFIVRNPCLATHIREVHLILDTDSNFLDACPVIPFLTSLAKVYFNGRSGHLRMCTLSNKLVRDLYILLTSSPSPGFVYFDHFESLPLMLLNFCNNFNHIGLSSISSFELIERVDHVSQIDLKLNNFNRLTLSARPGSSLYPLTDVSKYLFNVSVLSKLELVGLCDSLGHRGCQQLLDAAAKLNELRLILGDPYNNPKSRSTFSPLHLGHLRLSKLSLGFYHYLHDTTALNWVTSYLQYSRHDKDFLQTLEICMPPRTRDDTWIELGQILTNEPLVPLSTHIAIHSAFIPLSGEMVISKCHRKNSNQLEGVKNMGELKWRGNISIYEGLELIEMVPPYVDNDVTGQTTTLP